MKATENKHRRFFLSFFLAAALLFTGVFAGPAACAFDVSGNTETPVSASDAASEAAADVSAEETTETLRESSSAAPTFSYTPGPRNPFDYIEIFYHPESGSIDLTSMNSKYTDQYVPSCSTSASVPQPGSCIDITMTNRTDADDSRTESFIYLSTDKKLYPKILWDKLTPEQKLVTLTGPEHIWDYCEFFLAEKSPVWSSQIPSDSDLIIRSSYPEFTDFFIFDYDVFEYAPGANIRIHADCTVLNGREALFRNYILLGKNDPLYDREKWDLLSRKEKDALKDAAQKSFSSEESSADDSEAAEPTRAADPENSFRKDAPSGSGSFPYFRSGDSDSYADDDDDWEPTAQAPKTTKAKRRSDPFDVYDYDDPEDFWEDHEEEFEDYDDAFDYWLEAWED